MNRWDRWKTYRATILDDGVSQPAVAVRSDFLAVVASKDQRLLEVAGLVVLDGDAVLAAVGDVLVRLLGQKLQELQLHRHRVLLLLFVAVAELKRQIVTKRRQ